MDISKDKIIQICIFQREKILNIDIDISEWMTGEFIWRTNFGELDR